VRWAGHVAHMGEKVYTIFLGILEGKRPLGRYRLILKDNIVTYEGFE
jgi:hypothetical protein